MKNPNSKDNPCITSDPAMLTGDAFVKHFFRKENMYDEIRSSNGDNQKKMTTRSKAKQGNNLVLCLASKR
jgi:hypothetical protein